MPAFGRASRKFAKSALFTFTNSSEFDLTYQRKSPSVWSSKHTMRELRLVALVVSWFGKFDGWARLTWLTKNRRTRMKLKHCSPSWLWQFHLRCSRSHRQRVELGNAVHSSTVPSSLLVVVFSTMHKSWSIFLEHPRELEVSLTWLSAQSLVSYSTDQTRKFHLHL